MDNLVFADFLLQIVMITIFAFLLLTLVVSVIFFWSPIAIHETIKRYKVIGQHASYVCVGVTLPGCCQICSSACL